MHTLTSRVVLVVAAMLSTACGLVQVAPYTPPLTPEEQYSAFWAGKHQDDVMLRYGSPGEVVSLSTGNSLISYHREVAVSASRAVYGAYGGGGRSDSTTIFCDRRFEIDKTTSRVLRAVTTGNGCDYSL